MFGVNDLPTMANFPTSDFSRPQANFQAFCGQGLKKRSKLVKSKVFAHDLPTKQKNLFSTDKNS
jgi:hypothetical protein